MEAQPTTPPLAVLSLCGYPDLFSGEQDISNGLFVLPGNRINFSTSKQEHLGILVKMLSGMDVGRLASAFTAIANTPYSHGVQACLDPVLKREPV